MKHFYYLACPITGGYRRTLWDTAVGPERAGLGDFQAYVIEYNQDRAIAFEDSILAKLIGPVINPARCQNFNWTEKDYPLFWEPIIRTQVHTMILAPEWEMSSGCRAELALARQIGLPVLTSTLDEVEGLWTLTLSA